jgi:uncharacterized protein (TIGR03437 family)
MATKDTTFLIATATSSGGVTPVGVVNFTTGTGTSLGSVELVGSNGVATATLAVNGGQIGLSMGSPQTITASYNGSSPTVTASVTLGAQSVSASNGTPSISGMTNAGSFKLVYAPGMVLSVFGTQLAPQTAISSTVPFPYTMAGVSATINGEAVPLWYVSATQLNVQIPYETGVGAATIEINNNGDLISQTFLVAAAAPGIFTDVSGNIVNGLAPVAPGQETVLYLTGAGAVSPGVADGNAPAAGTPIASLPSPTHATTITVNGVPVQTIEFEGITVGLVSVVQVNFTVPSGLPTGTPLPVVVTISGAASTPAFLTLAN